MLTTEMLEKARAPWPVVRGDTRRPGAPGPGGDAPPGENQRPGEDPQKGGNRQHDGNTR